MDIRIKKTISWRFISTATTLSIAYLFTGSIKVAGAITFVEFFVKMLEYYYHEKIWDKIRRKEKRKRILGTSYSEAYRRAVTGTAGEDAVERNV